jgi:hypothetical protein
VEVEHRCRFMGLKALANGVVSFKNVKVPCENLIGRDGDGLKIALVTLNTGRLTLPAVTSGAAKQCLEILRKWGNARVQWGVPIGRHEAVAHKIADIAATAFALESTAFLVAELAEREGYDLRLEAAAAKEWNTARFWRVADDTLQVRGGRGFETERSLAGRGEPAIGVERMLRDSRVNLIFEGSSEIMHLFMAREAVDKHLQVAGRFIAPDATTGERFRALGRILAFYAWWYPARWLGWGWWPRYAAFGKLAKHLRFADRMSRKLARALFHGMLVHRAGLERKQGFLFRAVDVAMEIFVLTATVARAHALAQGGGADAASALTLADAHARGARRRVRQLFRDLWRNDDTRKAALAREVLEGQHRWLEQGTMGLPFEAADLTPPSMTQLLAAREGRGPEEQVPQRKAG